MSSHITNVVVHIYDMSSKNKYLYPMGIGIYHSGIEVYGVEFAFGGSDSDDSGIFQISPNYPIPGIQLRESIVLGQTSLSKKNVSDLVKEMAREYTGRSYHIILRNCNHFSNDFALRLCGISIPRWINRLAYFGSLVPCGTSQDREWLAPPDLSNTTNNDKNDENIAKSTNKSKT